MISGAFRSLLVADPNVYGQVSTRIYPMQAPESAGLPLIIYQRVSETTDADLLIHSTRMQVDCYATTYDAALQLAEDVRRALLNRTCITDTETILDISVISCIDMYDAETRISRVVTDFMLLWRFNNN